MPSYDYKCEKCNHVFEESHPISNRKKPEKKPCPNCKEKKTVKQMICNPAVCDPVKIGTKKVDKGFQEVLSKIKQHHPAHSMNKRWD